MELSGTKLRALTATLTAGSKVKFLLDEEELEVREVQTENVQRNPKTGVLEVFGTPHLLILLRLVSPSASENS